VCLSVRVHARACACLCMRVRVCVRACACACVRACVRALRVCALRVHARACVRALRALIALSRPCAGPVRRLSVTSCLGYPLEYPLSPTEYPPGTASGGTPGVLTSPNSAFQLLATVQYFMPLSTPYPTILTACPPSGCEYTEGTSRVLHEYPRCTPRVL
jgi:hypothetical protein